MDFFNSPYCNLNRQLLSAVGLWPYQNSTKFVAYRIFLTVILTAAVISQAMCLITMHVNLEFLIECLPIEIIPCGCIIIIWNRCINFDTMKFLLEQVKSDWNNAKSQAEIEILHRYLDIARRLNVIFSVYTLIAISAFVVVTFSSQIFDKLLPLNESRPKILPFQIEIFVDQQQHFNTVLMCVDMIVILVGVILVGNHNIFMLYIHHACGMFAVLTHRLEQTLSPDKNSPRHSSSKLRKYAFHRIGSCISDHLRAIQFAAAIDSCYSKYFLIIITGSVITFSLLLIQVLTISTSFDKKMRSAAFVIGHFIYLFINSYMGQQLIDLSSNVSNVVYAGHWYKLSIPSQKLLILLILKAMKPCCVSVGNFYALSFEKFTMVVQTTISYGMLIRQFQ